MLQKSPYYAPVMLRAVSLCRKHASTILQLIREFNYVNECSIGVFYLNGDCSIKVYRSFLSQLEKNWLIAIISALLNNKKAN